ncbi:MAG TPA: glycerophosphodiester phosphodiesterase [Thermohalobaculum sp.]|nr:glycerophosphodiester phosphodiesterase [Thermohalobaculum sp.]
MKLIAHRGWSAGAEENSLAVFARAAKEPCVSGIELDVRRGADGELVVAHDAPGPGVRALRFRRALSFLANQDLELLVELKETGIAGEVLDLLSEHGAADRATVVAFPEIAPSMPWRGRRRARLGILVRYPWQARRLAAAHRPDVLGLGWDSRGWTRRAFRSWCSLFRLDALGDRASADIVVGVVQDPDDLGWLREQGVQAAVADLGTEDAAPWRARMAAGTGA